MKTLELDFTKGNNYILLWGKFYEKAWIEQMTFTAAAQSVDITPPVGIHIHNWAYSPFLASTGIHQLLKAQVLAIGNDSNGSVQLLISMDLGWWMSAKDEWTFRKEILEHTDLSESQVVLALTHTHAGPSISREDVNRPGGEFIGPYLDSIQRKIGLAAKELLKNLQPCVIDWSYGSCSLAVNRDLFIQNEKRFVIGANPSVDCDRTLLVGRVATLNLTPIAVIANYAAHPTSLAGLNSKISPDYVGSARELVEKEFGGTFIFLQGASGDLSPRDQYSEDPAVAEKNGLILGLSVLSVLAEMLKPGEKMYYEETIESGAPLGSFIKVVEGQDSTLRSEIVKLNLRTQSNEPPPSTNKAVMADRLLRASRVRENVGEEFTPFPVTFQRIGEAILIAYPGEAYSYLQTYIRGMFPGRILLFVNLANGAHCGYIAPKSAYDDGRYPAWQSPLAVGCLEMLLENCEKYLTASFARE